MIRKDKFCVEPLRLAGFIFLFFIMKKNILIIIGIAAIFAGLFWLQLRLYKNVGASDSPSSGAQANLLPSVLGASELKYDFGSISMANGNVTHKFQINNTALEPVTITKVYTSCMCTTAILIRNDEQFGPFGMPGHGGPSPRISETMQPGEQAVLEVIFDPNAHGPAGVGRIARSVYIENDISEPLELQFNALVTP